ncbi:MAG: hypothetical protein KY463_05745, partial [Actinobacteria bacterium]|nr:hypothetical protein [Actinomycetota bacterium]
MATKIGFDGSSPDAIAASREVRELLTAVIGADSDAAMATLNDTLERLRHIHPRDNAKWGR